MPQVGISRSPVFLGGPNTRSSEMFYIEVEYDDDNFEYKQFLVYDQFQKMYPFPWQMWMSDLSEKPNHVINLRKLCHDIDGMVSGAWSISSTRGSYNTYWDLWFTNKDDMDLVLLALGV